MVIELFRDETASEMLFAAVVNREARGPRCFILKQLNHHWVTSSAHPETVPAVVPPTGSVCWLETRDRRVSRRVRLSLVSVDRKAQRPSVPDAPRGSRAKIPRHWASRNMAGRLL
jgi:hypothetical protein